MGDSILPLVLIGGILVGLYWFIFYAPNSFRDRFIRNPDGTYKIGPVLPIG